MLETNKFIFRQTEILEEQLNGLVDHVLDSPLDGSRDELLTVIAQVQVRIDKLFGHSISLFKLTSAASQVRELDNIEGYLKESTLLRYWQSLLYWQRDEIRQQLSHLLSPIIQQYAAEEQTNTDILAEQIDDIQSTLQTIDYRAHGLFMQTRSWVTSPPPPPASLRWLAVRAIMEHRLDPSRVGDIYREAVDEMFRQTKEPSIVTFGISV